MRYSVLLTSLLIVLIGCSRKPGFDTNINHLVVLSSYLQTKSSQGRGEMNSYYVNESDLQNFIRFRKSEGKSRGKIFS